MMPLLAGLASCDNDYAQPPLLTPEEANGTAPGAWNNPYTVNDVRDGMGGTGRWYVGYIVGWIDTSGDNAGFNATTAKFTTPATVSSNILMAATPDETNWAKCIPVQLPDGTVRTALNLVNNENLGKLVCVYGDRETYFSTDNALKNLTHYNWGDQGFKVSTNYLLSAPFTDADYAGFTLEGELPVTSQGKPAEIWTVGRYGLVATAYTGGTRYASDSWGVSPVVNLVGVTAPTLEFEWAGNYFTTVANMKSFVEIAVREQGGEWVALDVPTWPAGSNWDFVESGAITLAQWVGKKIQIGIHYKSTTSMAGTLEIRNLYVSAE